MKLQTLTIALVLAGLISACASPPSEPHPRTLDSSLSSALYLSETEFLDRKAVGDAYGMALAARTRLELVNQLDQIEAPENDPGDNLVNARRSASLLASVRDMVSTANFLARDDPDTLARIERLFPSSQTAQSSGHSDFNGLIGARRAVKVTVGLELDATLEANAEERVRLPVDASAGTTIYVQPVGHRYLDTPTELSMTVARQALGSKTWEMVDCPETSAARLPCFVPPGDHSEIEIRLSNRGGATIQALIFVSGNSESVAASLIAK